MFLVRRAGAAIFRGSDYQKELKGTLDRLKQSIDELEKQGERSSRHQDDLDFQRNRQENAALYQQNHEQHSRTQQMVQLSAMNEFYTLAHVLEELQGKLRPSLRSSRHVADLTPQ